MTYMVDTKHSLNQIFQTTFLSILFLMSLGMMLYNYGGIILSISGHSLSLSTLGVHAVNVMFAGSLLASLFWVSENLHYYNNHLYDSKG